MIPAAPVLTEPSETAHALARLALTVRLDDLPAAVVAQAKRILRDTVGVMLGGAALPEIRNLAAIAPGLAAGGASLFGTGTRAAAECSRHHRP